MRRLLKACGAPWDGWVKKTNAVLDSHKKVYKWRSMRRWQSIHTRMMKENPENRTKWKHWREWHNRGNVWDKMATCWAGKKDWMIAKKKKNKTRLRTGTISSLTS